LRKLNDDIILFDDYLSQDLYTELKEDLLKKQSQYVWAISKLQFGAGLSNPDADGSLLVSGLHGELRTKLLNEIAEKNNLVITPEDEHLYSTTHYIGNPHSAIDWHRDYLYEWAISIYLTDDWKPEYGGMFEFVDEETQTTYTITPKPNRAVEQFGDVVHRVTPVKPRSPVRYSIQVFKKINSTNIENSQDLKNVKLARAREDARK